MDLHGRTALVTGASSGIGEQFAYQLADRGADLVLVARGQHRLEQLRVAVQRAHPGRLVTVIGADLATSAGAGLVIEHLTAESITIDALINNAGVGSHNKVVDEDPAALSRQIQLNVASLVDLTVRLLPGMVNRDRGAILNVASTAAFQPVPTMAVYGATKAFVLSFTEALWVETRGTGVRVVTLCPGATETSFFDQTGKSFLTKGRQSATEVARVGMRALDGTAPTTVSGLSNRVGALGYRFLPRATIARVSARQVKEVA